MDIEFEPDSGTIRTHKQRKVAKAVHGSFEADYKGPNRANYEMLVERLNNGWGLREIPKHSVDDGHLTNFPTARCISEVFDVSVSTAYKILNLLRAMLVIHKVDLQLRAKRGDALTRFIKRLHEQHEAAREFKKFSKAFLIGREMHEAAIRA
jgi:hypothetical protein